MRKLLLAAFFALTALTVFGQGTYPSPIYTKTSNPFGNIWNRQSIDSALFLPTGCGIPTDTTWLFSQGPVGGTGQKLKKFAIYFDSCGGHFYGWNPAGSGAWMQIDGGGGGGLALADTAAAIRAWASASFYPSYNPNGYISNIAGLTAGGDLGGTYPNPQVVGILNNALPALPGSTPSFLKWNGSAWIFDNTTYVTGSVVYNLGGSPGIQTGLYASRPSAGSVTPGTQYVATDSAKIYIAVSGPAWLAISGAGSGVPGTPITKVGLSFSPGTATTYMRSDAGLALDVSISPTWTGTHTFSNAPIFSTLTGYLYGNGSGAITANTAIPTSALSGTISLSQIAAIAGHTYLGNNTGTAASPIAVTNTQLTADLNLFTSSLQGLVPASGGGIVNFLRADGSFAYVDTALGGHTYALTTLWRLYNTIDSAAAAISGNIPVGANPTAHVGLSAVNGSSPNFMRADASPALDVTISPTWSGTHTFSNAPILSSLTGYLYGNGSGAVTATTTIPGTAITGLVTYQTINSGSSATGTTITSGALYVRFNFTLTASSFTFTMPSSPFAGEVVYFEAGPALTFPTYEISNLTLMGTFFCTVPLTTLQADEPACFIYDQNLGGWYRMF